MKVVLSCVALAFCMLFFGCARKPRLLTDRDIQLMSNSRYSVAVIEYSDGDHWTLRPDEYLVMRKMIRALSPIMESRKGSIDSPQFVLLFQGGKDPTSIDVSVNDGQLEFSVGSFVYTGGDSGEFELLAKRYVADEG